eukprot:10258382-Heterocapsa_arctica.AAC.1
MPYSKRCKEEGHPVPVHRNPPGKTWQLAPMRDNVLCLNMVSEVSQHRSLTPTLLKCAFRIDESSVLRLSS